MTHATPSSEDAAVRRVVGLLLRAAERGETEALLDSIDDPASRLFLQELAACASRPPALPDLRPYSGDFELANPTSAELRIEEELEEELTLADPIETEVLVWLSRQTPPGAQEVWERALTLLADEETTGA